MNISNIFKIFFYKLTGKKLFLINESAGLGDYLWVRNYFKLIKNSDKYKDYKIIMCTTGRWLDFAKKLDSNYVSVFLSFKNPYNPTKEELLPLKLFKYDIFINFREGSQLWSHINNAVKTKERYTNLDVHSEKNFYHYKNNKIMEQIISIPYNFLHRLPLNKEQNNPSYEYCILPTGGFSEGKLSETQLEIIIKCILDNTINKNLKILVTGFKDDKPLTERILANIGGGADV